MDKDFRSQNQLLEAKKQSEKSDFCLKVGFLYQHLANSGYVAQSFRDMPHTHSGACRTVRRGETLVEYIIP